MFVFLKRAWMKFASVLGRVNSKIILSVFYLVIMGVVSIVRALLGLFRSTPKTSWKEKGTVDTSLERISNQS